MRRDAWKEGFEAGRDNDKRCPYHAGSVEAWSWWSGYIEGYSKSCKNWLDWKQACLDPCEVLGYEHRESSDTVA